MTRLSAALLILSMPHPLSRPLFLAATLAALLAGCAGGCGDPTEIQLASEGPEPLAALAVEVGPRPPADTTSEARAFVQASGGGAFYYDALAYVQDDPAMGLSVGGAKVLDGWSWWLDADSLALGGPDRHRGVARPDFAVRAYLQRDSSDFLGSLLDKIKGDDRARFVERITLLDSRDSTAALLVEAPDSLGAVAFRPVVASGAGADSARVVGESLVFYAGGTWTAVRASGGTPRVGDIETPPEAGRESANVPGEVAFETPGSVVVATGATPEAADARAGTALQQAGARREARSERLAALVESVPLATEDAEFDRAMRWAAVTLDMLVTEDSSRVYVAPGLPGAEPQPGLSTVQMTQAFLDLGEWQTARNLLTTFGDAQLFDRRADLLGRAPNVVLPGGEAEFQTADATPTYLAASGDYVRTTGDRSLVTGGANFWFKSVFAMRGLYEPDSRNGNALDANGFLLSRDGRAAWMETDPASGGFERRGPTVEAQGELYRALKTVRQYAEIMGVAGRSNTQWYADTARVLQDQFEQRFIADGQIADRLDARGQRVSEVRPTALLALDDFDLAPEAKARLARSIAERLAYPYGVGTLPQTDSLFHPFLHEPAFYPEGAARFGGAVSTWLAGPLARLMAETGGAEPAWELTSAQAQLVTGRGVIGAIPEFLDAHPRQSAGKVGVGGAPVQPWSVAELIRTAMEGFVGASWPDARTLQVRPHLPESWGATTTRLRLGSGTVGLVLRQSGGALTATVTPEGQLPEGASLRLVGAEGAVSVPLAVAQGDTAFVARPAFEVEIDGTSATVDGESAEAEAVDAAPEAWEGFAFVEPELRDEYPVMRAVENRRDLSGSEILQTNARARIISTQTDPQGDDWGSTNTFTYPEGIPEGVLDATYLEVTADDSTTYVRIELAAMADASGEGGQPTFVAVAFDTEEGGERRVGRNALFDFPEDEGYEFIVYLGDGIEIENARGQGLGSLSRRERLRPRGRHHRVRPPALRDARAQPRRQGLRVRRPPRARRRRRLPRREPHRLWRQRRRQGGRPRAERLRRHRRPGHAVTGLRTPCADRAPEASGASGPFSADP